MRRGLRVFQGLLVFAALVVALVAVIVGFQGINEAADACPSPTNEDPVTFCNSKPTAGVRATASIALGITALTCAVSAAAMNGWGRPKPEPE